MFSARGPGFRRLAETHAASVAGDTLVTIALAGTLFFQVPSAEDARQNVALYLLLTLAPFAIIGPFLGTLFARFPAAYRGGLVVGAASRAILAVLMVMVGVDTVWLFPLAFLLLVFSRFHGISRNSLLPVVVDRPVELVSANARLARIGVLAGAAVAPLGAGAMALFEASLALILAAVLFVVATWAAFNVPPARHDFGEVDPRARELETTGPRFRVPRSVRLARLATAGVRFLNGFLLLLIAFEFRSGDESGGVLDFGFLLGAAGAGYFMASLIAPWLEVRLREEPMVVAALAVEAAAAFIVAQTFDLWLAAVLAAAAGFAWGTAKFGFDGLLQANVAPDRRAGAFTIAETLFQLVWVIGALIPTVVDIPMEAGLAAAGVVALATQVVYISGLLMPYAQGRRAEGGVEAQAGEEPFADRYDVTDFL